MNRLLYALALSTLMAAAACAQRAGANAPHWAFQKLSNPAFPKVRAGERARTPIDAFILAKLEAKKLTLSPDADAATLVRRAHFDLLGLPPSPEDVADFEKSAIKNLQSAIENLLDRLLASPHFGERWGRHWLDNAGYVDVVGADNDAGIISLGENKWRYRDYVVRSFNADKPFDRFLTEQIAGDELVDWRTAKEFGPELKELLIATGFLRTTPDDTDSPELNTPDIRHGILQRTGEVVASNLLALTMNCAKCHDHKYEPIRQRDYYQFLAIFQPAFNPENWLPPAKRLLADIPRALKAEADKHNAELDRLIGEEKMRLEKIKSVKPLSGEDQKAVVAGEKKIQEWTKQQKRGWEHLQVVYDVGPPTPTRLLKRGNHERPGAEVQPAFFRVLCPNESALVSPQRMQAETSGRRLALAKWLTDPDTPAGALVLRVRINRIWQQLFGKGLVETVDNFGVTGAKPSHPELLDWLASDFRANGQRLKPLLKKIMLSSVYRQSSKTVGQVADLPERRQVGNLPYDPDNKLLWRMRLRRLESEAIRDTMLAVSGKLDRTLGGPPIPVEGKPDGTFVVKTAGLPTPTSQYRRSLYLLQRRNYHPTILGVFDQPTLTSNCSGRTSSAVVLQSLTLLNDPFVQEQAKFLAERVAKSAGGETPEKLSARAYRLVLTRSPTERELTLCIDHLRRQTEAYERQKMSAQAAREKALENLCHMLLNANELLYVP
jgi:hypothetical protein